MNIIDLIIAAVLLVGFILGFKDGFVRKLIGSIGLVLAIITAVIYSDEFGKMLVNVFGLDTQISDIVAGVVIFLVIILIFSIIKRLIHPFDKVNNLINQILGGIVGLIQILFFLSAVLYLLNIFNIPDKEDKESSLLYSFVYSIIPATVDWLQDYTPATKDYIKDYINDKDSI